jgi:hypothetical protein
MIAPADARAKRDQLERLQVEERHLEARSAQLADWIARAQAELDQTLASRQDVRRELSRVRRETRQAAKMLSRLEAHDAGRIPDLAPVLLAAELRRQRWRRAAAVFLWGVVLKSAYGISDPSQSALLSGLVLCGACAVLAVLPSRWSFVPFIAGAAAICVFGALGALFR